jgi:hypothetical protein
MGGAMTSSGNKVEQATSQFKANIGSYYTIGIQVE